MPATPRDPHGWDPFPSSRSEVEGAREASSTDAASAISAARLAFDDPDFLTRAETRGLRLQLEWMKPELHLIEAGIRSTIVLFGGARIPEPGTEAWAARNESQKRNLEAASKYYDEARRFAQIASRHSANSSGGKEFVIATGGGPGVMEAGNRGAKDVGAVSIAFNISVPHEQEPNRYVTPELSFGFHYFAIRKMHFLQRAKAIAIFPGGFGTLDELFEALALIQTKKMQRIPVILFHREFWQRVLDIEALAELGTIAPGDLDLLTYAETAEDGWEAIRAFYDIA
ncbi:MAG: LOG family protein [Fulvimarina manganoxydans]|uniref:LOG family protein n=1 Tax=Fulvimarina manganoxydans TaxID=937218 RepID=UPI00235692D6|nr:LOG family protein [Fulvimarina manganoxydans]MCK5933464.1 LOG family protein [Fulvimarina manganoxydans]